MRRTSKVGTALIAAAVLVGGLGLPTAAAAPVQFSPTPIAGWSTNGPVRAVLIVGDTVYAGGDFTTVRPPGGGTAVPRARLAAWDIHTGALRTGFSADANGFVRKLETDGTRLFVGGSFTTIKGVSRSRLAAVDLTSGDVVTGFSANVNSHVYGLKVSGTRLFVAGAFSSIGGTSRSRLAAVSTTTGAVDPTFNPNANTTVSAVTVSPDGTRVYAGGNFSAIGGGSRQYIATLSPTTGALQPLVFQHSTYGQVLDLDISPNGDRLFAALADLQNLTIAWSTTNGNRLWYHQVDGDAQAVRHYAGNVYFGFHEGDVGDYSVRMLVADATTGVVIPTYRLPINSFYGVWDIDASPDALVIGGEFTNVNGVATQGIAILPTSGAPPPPPPESTVLVSSGSTWRYLANGSDQGTAWRAPTFNDGAWAQGAAQLGYGDGDETTVVPFGPNANQKYITTYFRQQFTVDNPGALSNVNLQLLRDDGAVVYLNGTEIVRSNMPGGTISYTTLAFDAGSNENQFHSFTVPASAFVAGVNTFAVEVHQAAPNSSDLSFDLSLSAELPQGPAAPTNLRTTTVTGTSVALAWNAPSGTISGYRVFRNGVLVGSPSGTTHNDTGLTSAQTYSYTVTAVASGGPESAPSAPLVVTTADVIAPTTPTGLAASSVTATQVVLTWNPSSDNVGVTGYEVLRGGVLIASTATPGVTNSGLAANQTYSYTVRARDAAGNLSPLTTPLVVTTPDLTGDTTPPSVPQNLRTVSRSATSVNLAWNASNDDTGVTGYIVSRNGVDLPGTSQTTLTDGLLAPGVSYTYRVRAIDGALNQSGLSAPLEVTTHLAAETTFPAGSVWRYTDDGIDRATAWRAAAYNDSAWKTGAGILGYHNNNETTVMWNGGTVSTDRFLSHYFRRSFTITDAAQVTGATLSVLRDDGVVVYVNGVEAFRNNMPTGTINYNTYALTGIEGAAETVYTDFAIPPSLLVEGTNVIAVSVHQNWRGGSGDLSFDARLTTRY